MTYKQWGLGWSMDNLFGLVIS